MPKNTTASPASPPAADEPGSKDDLEALAAEATDAPETPTTVDYRGVTYEIDSDAVGDVELIEALANYVEDGNALMLPRIVKAMVGVVQYDAFKKAARDPETGRVPMSELREFFRLIDDALGE